LPPFPNLNDDDTPRDWFEPGQCISLNLTIGKMIADNAKGKRYKHSSIWVYPKGKRRRLKIFVRSKVKASFIARPPDQGATHW
jgi:hypothetical protein